MREVFCLDTGERFFYSENKTPYEALKGMLYTLNLKYNDPKAMINKTKSGKCLFFNHNGRTYSVINK